MFLLSQLSNMIIALYRAIVLLSSSSHLVDKYVRFLTLNFQTSLGVLGLFGNILSIIVISRIQITTFFDSLFITLCSVDSIFILFTIVDYSLARGDIKCPRQPSYKLSFIELHTVKQAIILYPLN